MNTSIMNRLFALLIGIALVSCGGEEPEEVPQNLRNYYFPYATFMKPQIYKFINEDNPSNVFYLHMQTGVIDKDTMMMTTAYVDDLKPTEVFVEKMLPEKIVLEEYTFLNLYGQAEPVTTNPTARDVYVYNTSKSKTIEWSVDYNSKYGAERIGKKRNLDESGIQRKVQGEVVNVAKFKEVYDFPMQTDGNIEQSSFDQYSYYAEGIGLVEYERTLASGEKSHFILDEIITEDKWNKMLEDIQ